MDGRPQGTRVRHEGERATRRAEKQTSQADRSGCEALSSFHIPTEPISQTLFTRHAPSVERKIELFDQEFEEVLRDNQWTAKNSRQRAAGRLQTLVDTLRKDQQRAR